MARILCITSGLTGILNASFELVNRLQAAGHECLCASPADVGEGVQEQGFTYIQLPHRAVDPAPEVPTFPKPVNKPLRYAHKLLNAQKRLDVAIQNLQTDAFKEIVSSCNPDLVIVDIELHEYIIALHSMNRRFVLLSQWFSLWHRNGLPPLIYNTIPTPENRAALELQWHELVANRTATFDRLRKRSAGTDRRSVLLEFARREGFPMEYIQENFWPGPISYDQLPVLAMTAQEMEFPHDVRPNLWYVGPMVSANRVEKSIPEITNLLQEKGQRKLIYCTVSTFKEGDVEFLNRLCQACLGQSDWLLVIALGGKLSAADLGALPENVHAFSYVPQLEVLKQADLSINHGGIHTINECVEFEVPMLVYSGKRSDQPGCAARVQFHGLGLMADKDADSVDQIRDNISQMLSDGRFGERVQRMHASIQYYRSNTILEQKVKYILAADAVQKSSLE